MEDWTVVEGDEDDGTDEGGARRGGISSDVGDCERRAGEGGSPFCWKGGAEGAASPDGLGGEESRRTRGGIDVEERGADVREGRSSSVASSSTSS